MRWLWYQVRPTVYGVLAGLLLAAVYEVLFVLVHGHRL